MGGKFDCNGHGREECCNALRRSLMLNVLTNFFLINKAKQSPKADLYTGKKDVNIGAREKSRDSRSTKSKI
jgi:hypothetical protein